MFECIFLGENLIGYNIFGFYVLVCVKKDLFIGVVFIKDYNLVFLCVIFINKVGKNFNVVKLWVDYIFFKCGQIIIVNDVQLFVICGDVIGVIILVELIKQLGVLFKFMLVFIELLDYLDQKKCLDFLKQWKEVIKK